MEGELNLKSQIKIKDSSSFNPLISTGLNNSFQGKDLNFPEYIKQSQEMIRKTHPELSPKMLEKVIAANSPFELAPAKTNASSKIKNGMLLVHGLFDSPLTMLSLGHYFANKNYLVRSILLPGHGSVPGDLLNIRYEEWIKAVAYGIQSLQQDVENVYICGFSTGALLGLHEALVLDNIKGLVLFAPPLQYHGYLTLATRFHLWLSRRWKGLNWYSVQKPYQEFAKYQSFCFNAPDQVYLLSQATQQLAKQTALKTPLFVICSADDELLRLKATVNFFSHLTNPLDRLLIYANKAFKFSDPRIEVHMSRYPEKHILNFSHICLPIAMDHYYYGVEGEFLKQQQMNGLKNCDLGANKRFKFRNHIGRLTYNPDFEGMMEKIEGFLERIE